MTASQPPQWLIDELWKIEGDYRPGEDRHVDERVTNIASAITARFNDCFPDLPENTTTAYGLGWYAAQKHAIKRWYADGKEEA